MSELPDCQNGRQRWVNRYFFIQACVGSAIGLGNIWKFPYLTVKHGSWQFIMAYAFALAVVGLPMMILELTLGQKMQRGSAGAQRGIMPRLAGAGWAASIAGFITGIIYNILLGLVLFYMFQGGAQPWKEYSRAISCQTAAAMKAPDSEIYLFMEVTKLFGEDNCQPYVLGDETQFAWGLYGCVVITWFICFLCVIKGPVSIGYVTVITEKLPFLFVFILLAKYTGLNSSVDGKGIQFYLGTEQMLDLFGTPYSPSENSATLFTDAYNQVFFSIGVCVGVMYAYGSYNHVKKPVIMDSVIICVLDFAFSIIVGFIVWGCIGYLYAKGNVAYMQQNSVGLTFVAFAEACKTDENIGGWFTFFMFFIYISGIDSAFSYIEALVTNIIDSQHDRISRGGTAFLVCFFGALISVIFTTNFGWVLFDLVDHYISNYLVLAVGFMQCVSVGWFFEKDSTASLSPNHAKSIKWLGMLYWGPMIIINFYSNFVFGSGGMLITTYVVLLFVLISFYVSFKVSEMNSRIWYHEILLCGVDKLSMSITVLSNKDGSRSWWMIVFEGYFAMAIKFINPAVLVYLIFNNMKADLDDPYAEQPQEMQVYATTFLFAAWFMIIVSMFICDYPELFEHNVQKEFNADNMYAANLRLKEEFGRIMSEKDPQIIAAGKVTPELEMQNRSIAPLVSQNQEESQIPVDEIAEEKQEDQIEEI